MRPESAVSRATAREAATPVPLRAAGALRFALPGDVQSSLRIPTIECTRADPTWSYFRTKLECPLESLPTWCESCQDPTPGSGGRCSGKGAGHGSLQAAMRFLCGCLKRPSREQSWNVLWIHHKNAASPLRSAIPRPGAAVSWQKRLPMRAYDPAWLFHRRCRRRQDRRQRRSEKGRAPSMRWFDSLASIRPNDVWYNPGTLLEMGDRSGGENQCTR